MVRHNSLQRWARWLRYQEHNRARCGGETCGHWATEASGHQILSPEQEYRAILDVQLKSKESRTKRWGSSDRKQLPSSKVWVACGTVVAPTCWRSFPSKQCVCKNICSSGAACHCWNYLLATMEQPLVGQCNELRSNCAWNPFPKSGHRHGKVELLSQLYASFF